MSLEQSAYLDISALPKWYLNEVGAESFVDFLQGLGSPVISSLTDTEMRSLLRRLRRMGDLRFSWSRCCLQPSTATSIVVGCCVSLLS